MVAKCFKWKETQQIILREALSNDCEAKTRYFHNVSETLFCYFLFMKYSQSRIFQSGTHYLASNVPINLDASYCCILTADTDLNLHGSEHGSVMQ